MNGDDLEIQYVCLHFKNCTMLPQWITHSACVYKVEQLGQPHIQYILKCLWMSYSDFGSNLLSPKVFCYGSNEANRVLKNSRRVLSESWWHKWNIWKREKTNNRFAAVALTWSSLLEFSDSESSHTSSPSGVEVSLLSLFERSLRSLEPIRNGAVQLLKPMAITFWSQVKSRIQVKTWVWLHHVRVQGSLTISSCTGFFQDKRFQLDREGVWST